MPPAGWLVRMPQGPPFGRPGKGEVMGREARVALLLTAAACLTAVMVEWAIAELQTDTKR